MSEDDATGLAEELVLRGELAKRGIVPDGGL
jgi:hypothetical protein